MHNPLIESELQDICAFRKSILNSFQNIQNNFLKTHTPLKLNTDCPCSQPIIPFDPFSNCSFEDKTTNYFSQKEDFWAKGKTSEAPFQNSNLLNMYQDQYNLRKLNDYIEPLKQRLHLENISIAPSTNKKSQLKSHHLSSQTKKQHETGTKSIVPPSRRNLSFHHNYQKASNTPGGNKENSQPHSDKYIIRGFGQNKDHISENKASGKHKIKRRRLSYSEATTCKLTQIDCSAKKGLITQRQLWGTQGQLSGRKVKNNPKPDMKQTVYKNIKKRIYLSSVLYKQYFNDSIPSHHILDKERQQIIKKIMDSRTVMNKYSKPNTKK